MPKKTKRSREEILAKRQAARQQTQQPNPSPLTREVLRYGSTAEEIARHLNTHRRPEGYRFLSTAEVEEALDELVEAGEIVVTKPADRWRENHRWVGTAAVYGPPPT